MLRTNEQRSLRIERHDPQDAHRLTEPRLSCGLHAPPPRHTRHSAPPPRRLPSPPSQARFARFACSPACPGQWPAIPQPSALGHRPALPGRSQTTGFPTAFAVVRSLSAPTPGPRFPHSAEDRRPFCSLGRSLAAARGPSVAWPRRTGPDRLGPVAVLLPAGLDGPLLRGSLDARRGRGRPAAAGRTIYGTRRIPVGCGRWCGAQRRKSHTPHWLQSTSLLAPNVELLPAPSP